VPAQTSTPEGVGVTPADVRFGSKADMCSASAHVRFAPNSDIDCVLRRVRFAPQSDIVFELTDEAEFGVRLQWRG
jgi:hypothetical protein